MEAVRSVSASGDLSDDVSCDVAVVGLGPVGAVLCTLLGERGINVVAIEPDAQPAPLPRAIAADDEMLRTLLRLPGMSAAAGLFDTGQRVEVRDASHRLLTTVGFEGSRLGVSGLSFFHQPTLERALRDAVEGSSNVRVLYGPRVTRLTDRPDAVRLQLDDGSAVVAKWVVGCDGATSTMRRLRQIPYTGRTFSEPWLVIDLDCPVPLALLPCFTYVLDRRRPAVNMPRPGGHRFEFMLLPGEEPAALAAPESVERLLEPYLAPLTGTAREQLEVVRATVYTYHSRLAGRWRDGRILLAGDAAHCMPPFGGQGLGSGIGDALALAWRLDEVVRGLATPRILDGYEAERRPRIVEMTRTALIAGRLLTARSRAGSLAARSLLRLIDATPWLGTQFRSGALRAIPKRALPNPRVRVGISGDGDGGGAVERLDDVVPAGWALLGRGSDPSRAMSESTRSALQARSALTFAVLTPGELGRAATLECPSFEDLDGTLLALWPRRVGSEAVALISPNRFIAAIGDDSVIGAALAPLTGMAG